MVTKRAKLWLTRGTTIGMLVIALVFAVATWIQAASIATTWLTVERSTDFGSAVLVEVRDGSALLTDGDDLERQGLWAIRNRDGFMRLGAVVETTEIGVRRAVLGSWGSIRPGSGVQFTRNAYTYEDPPVELVDVVIDGQLGENAAWMVEGSEDTWVILVHGNGADRSQALALVPALARDGYPILIPTYRNDLGAPSSKGEHHGFGRDEWRDLDAAVDFALAAGARDFVLVGFGSGGSIVGTFLYNSSEAERVVGVVLDAPVLSLGISVDEEWRPAQVPGFIVGWSKALATFRFGVDWAELDHVSRADEWAPPVLIMHGRDDLESPIRASLEFASARIDSTLLLTFAGAGPGASWNSDPQRYEAALRAFVDQHGAGESEFEALDPGV